MVPPLVVRQFFFAGDVSLDRLWEWHDSLADLPGVDYRLHLLGRYEGPHEEMLARPYVISGPSLLSLVTVRRTRNEVWILRGWYPPVVFFAAVLARIKRVPRLLFQERPGLTYRNDTIRLRLKARIREVALPLLFWPYRSRTVVLGTGQQALDAFAELSPGAPAYSFPYPCPTADELLAESDSTRATSSLPSFLFVGRFEHRKAVDLIMEACEGLWREGHAFTMRYVGDGPLRDRIVRHVEEHAHWAQVYPFADRATLMQHYRTTDTVLFPSRFDGWGLVVHEALAAGKPVIVSDACGSAGLVSASGCGIVIEAGDVGALKAGMTRMLPLSPAAKMALRTQGTSMASRLTISRLNAALLTYCREALNRYG